MASGVPPLATLERAFALSFSRLGVAPLALVRVLAPCKGVASATHPCTPVAVLSRRVGLPTPRLATLATLVSSPRGARGVLLRKTPSSPFSPPEKFKVISQVIKFVKAIGHTFTNYLFAIFYNYGLSLGIGLSLIIS